MVNNINENILNIGIVNPLKIENNKAKFECLLINLKSVNITNTPA